MRTRNRRINIKICCNFAGLKKIFFSARRKIRKDLIRIRLEQILREPARKISAQIPILSTEQMKIVGDNIEKFLAENTGISHLRFRQMMTILPLSLIAVCPEFDEECIQLLLKVIIEELEDHGKMFTQS